MLPEELDTLNKSSIEKEIQDLKDLVNSLKEMGANVEATEAIIAQAEKGLEDNNLEIAKALLESATQTAKLTKQQYFIQASSILFSSLQRTIVNLEGAGSEVNYIKDLYNKAKEMFDSGQYEEAMGYIKSAEDMAHDLKADLPEGTVLDETSGEVVTQADLGEDQDQSRQQMESVSKILIRVEKQLQEAIDAGYSINEIEKLYSLAEDSFDYQDYKKAEGYALECEGALEDTLRPMRQNIVKKREEIKPEENINLGRPISEFREHLPTGNGFTARGSKISDDMMPMGILGDAPKSEPEEVEAEPPQTQESDEAIDPELEIEKEATNMLILADEKISGAKTMGLNLPMAERLLTIGESYFDRGDFDKVKEYASKAIKQVDEIISRRGYPEGATTTGGEEAEAASATGTLEPKATRAVETRETKLTGGKKSKTAEKLESALSKIASDIAEVKELGVSINNTEELIETAFEELDADNLAEAKELGIQAKNKIMTIKKNFIKKKALQLIKVAWKEIEQGEDRGIDVAKPKTMLKDARNLIKQSKFEKAAKLAIDANQMIKKL